MSNNDLAICCRNATKVFHESGSRNWRSPWRRNTTKVVAVDDVTFDVYRNEVFGLLGSNGSGKSTLIRLLSTLLVPDSGDIKMLGYNVVTQHHKIRPLISRVSVEAAFFKKLSSIENLRYAARTYGIDPDKCEQQALEILERLGIPKAKTMVPLEHLSRGMQQKIAIARALMTDPKLILLDEPTTGLDPKSRRDVQKYVQQIMKDKSLTIFLTTHDMAEAEALCSRIAIINDGRIVALDTPGGLKQLANASSLEEAFITLAGKSMEGSLSE